MTPAAAIRDEAARLRSQADRLDALADRLDAGAPQARPAVAWISTGRAQQILRLNSPSSVYRLIDRHPDIGRRGLNGHWQIDETKLRELIEGGRGENGEASGESGECTPVFTLR